MGLFDLFKRKKKEPVDYDSLARKEMGLEQPDLGLHRKPAGLNEKSPFDELDRHASGQMGGAQEAVGQEPMMPRPPAAQSGQDLELINSKLDTLKAILNSIDQRVANLERVAGADKKERRLW